MAAYYNEFDPYAAQWLRNLIDSKLIAEGDVDDRSIRDVASGDLKGYTQCHFFAGIGVWSYALRLAGWPDDRPVWTGSCPCQPFSAAGKGAGFADERHLWPEFHRLIAECHPPVVFGEQVASKDGLGWLDTVRTDMEASGYAIGAADLCAAGVGAPHIRQRLWFVGERLADTASSGQSRSGGGSGAQGQRTAERSLQSGLEGLDDTAGARHDRALAGPEGEARDEARLRLSGEGRGPRGLANAALDGRRQGIEDGGRLRSGDRAEGSAGRSAIDSDLFGGLGHHHHQGLEGQRSGHQAEGGRLGTVRPIAETGKLGGMADASGIGWGEGRVRYNGRNDWNQPDADVKDDRPRPTNGHWRAADWLHCRDGKWRPVEACPQPLADGSAESLGRVRPEAIQEIEEALDAAAMESESSRSALLQALRENLGAQARSVWAAGRLPGLHEAPFLLAFLRQLQIEGWCLKEGGALSREEAEAGFMRVLRGDEAAAGSPHRRKLEEQRARKSADAVHLLSSLLARHAQASWAHAYETYAEIGFPIGHGAPARVGRLRAYGNAIVPQAAAEVIGAYLDARP